MRLLLVDDDSGFRALLRTTFEDVEVDVDEAGSAAEAEQRISAQRPDVIVLDVGMPGMDGLAFCRELKESPDTSAIRIVLLTGMDDVEDVAGAAGADALLLKPFRPLELLGVVERLAGTVAGAPMRSSKGRSGEEQLVLYARDLRHLVEIERAQRGLLESAYKETVSALASALGTKDTGTRQHSQRVQRYALELAAAIDPALAADPALEYGFLLHDIGKIGVPDQILLKPGPLSEAEWRVMKAHTLLGAQMIGGVAFLQEAGVEIVRSHHERWDGTGYPDGLVGEEIPIGARIFAVADAIDAITNHRPYREARSWRDSRREIVEQKGTQFDPQVVDAFCDREHVLHEIRREFLAAAGTGPVERAVRATGHGYRPRRAAPLPDACRRHSGSCRGPYSRGMAHRMLTTSFWLRSARETVYALASLPLGVLWFSVVVTMLGLSAGFAITIVGLPVLLLTLGLVRVAAALERRWAELALGELLPAAAARPGLRGPDPWWRRFWALVSEVAVWREVLYLLLLLPVGIVLFVVAVTSGRLRSRA